MKVMKNVWRGGTAPRCTSEVLEFVEKHIHEKFFTNSWDKENASTLTFDAC